MADLRIKAEAGELVLLSQDEARFAMVATLAAALGVKGFRLAVGTRNCKDLLYVLAVINVVTGAVHSTTLESPARDKQKTGKSKESRQNNLSNSGFGKDGVIPLAVEVVLPDG